MSKTIKLWDGVKLTTDSGEIVCASPVELWEHITATEEMQKEITRQLFCFGYLDLTEACGGEKCVLQVIPVGK